MRMLSQVADLVLGATARAGELVADEEQRIVIPRDGGCAARTSGPAHRPNRPAEAHKVIPFTRQRLGSRR